MVSSILKHKGKYFQAVSPDILFEYLKGKIKEIKEKERILKSLIPSLNKLMKTKKKYSTKRYEGFEGIKMAIDELLPSSNKDEEYLAMGIITAKKKRYNQYWINWHQKRTKKGIKARLIFSELTKTDYYKNLAMIPKTKIKRISLQTYSATAIFGDKVLIFDYNDDPSCIIIENSNISSTYKEFFENMWKSAED